MRHNKLGDSGPTDKPLKYVKLIAKCMNRTNEMQSIPWLLLAALFLINGPTSAETEHGERCVQLNTGKNDCSHCSQPPCIPLPKPAGIWCMMI